MIKGGRDVQNKKRVVEKRIKDVEAKGLIFLFLFNLLKL
jgi:hypothetical protein